MYYGDDLKMNVRIMNRGTANVSGFTIAYDIPGIAQDSVHIGSSLQSGKYEEIQVTFPPVFMDSMKGVTLNLSVADIDEGDDLNPDNNKLTLSFNSADKKFRKMVLVEEFTTELCGNCPIAAPIVMGAVETFEESYPHSVAVICHHSGFHTDFLTTPYDEEYLYLFGGGTYAPAIMVDRYAQNGKSPTGQVSTTDNLLANIEEAYLHSVGYSLEAYGEYDPESRTIAVNVEGERLYQSEDLPERISVVIVENDIPQQAQNNAPSDYRHQHAMRYANSTWGDIIEWNGNLFDYNHTIQLPEEWVEDNLEIIVYISKYDESDFSNCAIENTRKLTLSGLTLVESIKDTERLPTIKAINGTITVDAPYSISAVWTSDGRCVPACNLVSGVYFVRVTGNGINHTSKIMVK